MLKELTAKEALVLMAEKYPEKVKCIFWNAQANLEEVETDSEYPFKASNGFNYRVCAIEIGEQND